LLKKLLKYVHPLGRASLIILINQYLREKEKKIERERWGGGKRGKG